MPDLLIATKNAHKTTEIQAMLGSEWRVTDLNAHPEVESPEETGETFRENAEIKAVAASRTFPAWCSRTTPAWKSMRSPVRRACAPPATPGKTRPMRAIA